MAHINELIDFVVNAHIVYENRVLLVLHKKLNRWLSVGGHIELNEDPEQALFREIKEECGLEVEIMGPSGPNIEEQELKFKALYCPLFLDIHTISETHKHVGMNYFFKAKTGNFVFNKEEHNDIRWFSKDDLENPDFDILSSIKFYSAQALKMVKEN